MTYHTFMVAQDHLSFYIRIGTYNKKYLDYIFGPGNALVLPTGGTVPFLQIQEFRPFEVDSEANLTGLLEIVILYFLIWQLERTQAGSLIRKAVDRF